MYHAYKWREIDMPKNRRDRQTSKTNHQDKPRNSRNQARTHLHIN